MIPREYAFICLLWRLQFDARFSVRFNFIRKIYFETPEIVEFMQSIDQLVILVIIDESRNCSSASEKKWRERLLCRGQRFRFLMNFSKIITPSFQRNANTYEYLVLCNILKVTWWRNEEKFENVCWKITNELLSCRRGIEVLQFYWLKWIQAVYLTLYVPNLVNFLRETTNVFFFFLLSNFCNCR